MKDLNAVISTIVQKKEAALREVVENLANMPRTDDTMADIANMAYDAERLRKEISDCTALEKHSNLLVLLATSNTTGETQRWAMANIELVEALEDSFDLVATPGSPIGQMVTEALVTGDTVTFGDCVWSIVETV